MHIAKGPRQESRGPFFAAKLSFEQFGPELLRRVGDVANDDVPGFFSEENIMALKRVAAKAWSDFVGSATYAGKFGEELERAFKSGMVGVGLIAAKRFLGVPVDVEQPCPSALGDLVVRHAVFAQPVLGRARECLPWSCR